uniref:Uncharacterized protein n=1 Tax=Solanum tuberosum TaxID=4113 RepID=M1DF99_SOLTU
MLSYNSQRVFIVFKDLYCSGSFGIVSRDRRSTRRSALWAQHTGTKGEDKTIWQFAEWVRQFSDLHFFVLLAAFVPFLLSSIHAFPKTPNT